jgi:hypothetical protein
MKLKVGECYRLRNGEVVGPLIARDYDSAFKFEDYSKIKGYSWDEYGRWACPAINVRDIVEHIPKEKDMKEQMIKGTASVYASGTIGYYDIHVTLGEAERLGAEAQLIKAENEIKAGDWVKNKENKLIGMVEKVGRSIVYCLENVHWGTETCTKITNPAHIQALNEIYEGMK